MLLTLEIILSVMVVVLVILGIGIPLFLSRKREIKPEHYFSLAKILATISGSMLIAAGVFLTLGVEGIKRNELSNQQVIVTASYLAGFFWVAVSLSVLSLISAFTGLFKDSKKKVESSKPLSGVGKKINNLKSSFLMDKVYEKIKIEYESARTWLFALIGIMIAVAKDLQGWIQGMIILGVFFFMWLQINRYLAARKYLSK